jgi:hypothetical protein
VLSVRQQLAGYGASAQTEKAGRRVSRHAEKMEPVTIATFEDTCGNLIQIAQQ